ncbi:MAG: ATP-binding protein [Pseudomonadota bacterium]
MPAATDSSRFEGWLWLGLPALAVALIGGLLLSIATVQSHVEARNAQGLQTATALAESLAAGFVTRTAADLRKSAELLIAADRRISAIAVRDAQGQSRLELRRDSVPAEGFWSPFIWASAPVPITLEAPIPGAVSTLAAQPPAIRLWLFPPASDAPLRESLTRLWGSLALALALSLPALMFALRRVMARHSPLLAMARTMAQGRFELRAPKQSGMSGALALALNQIADQLQALKRQTPAGEDSTLLRQDLARERGRLRALEQELNAARELARQRGGLIGSLAHELRTPLAALVGHADLLVTENLTGSSRDSLRLLKSSARQLMQLINDLLDWSRIENGQIALTRQSFDLATEIEETLRLLAPLAYEKGLELSHLIYHDVPAALTGDAARLRQILTNLISNAIKFTARGEVVLRVMKERSDQDRILLSLRVSDTGVGIAPDQLARLFLPYQRLQDSGASGTGLGLAITRHLVERMGGTIKVESEPGQGSHFQASIWLETSPGANQEAITALRGLRVWIADESPSARLALRHRLEWWGAPTTEFENPAALLKALRAAETQPDLLIVGIPSVAKPDPALPELVQGPPLLLRVNTVASQHRDLALTLGIGECLPKCASSRELASALIRLSGRAAPAPPQPVLKNRWVLLAENNAASRLYLKAMLESLGAQVLEAENGRVALEQCLNRTPDLALLDLHMPERDGISCAREIRARSTKRIPLIAISAHLEPEEQDALKLAGVDAVLLKPFDALQLQATAAPLLNQPVSTDSPAMTLVEDRELRALLRQELPLQLQNLEAALASKDPAQARDAAHQLHGSCSFYQLPDLKRAAAAVEIRLAQGEWPNTAELSALRAAGERTLRDLAA